MEDPISRPTPNSELPNALDLLKPSWQAVRLNIITFIELILIPVILNLLGAIFAAGHQTALGVIFRIIGELSAVILGPALVITQLTSARGDVIDFSPAVRQGLKFFWRYLGLVICMVVIIGVGFILLIVPGFFMLRRYILAPYYLIDQDLSIFDALDASAKQSKEFSNAVWGLLGVTILFAVLSIILVGIVLSVMYYCAPALRYLGIKKKLGAFKPKSSGTAPAVKD